MAILHIKFVFTANSCIHSTFILKQASVAVKMDQSKDFVPVYCILF